MFLTEEEKQLTIQGCRFCPMCYHADVVPAITCKETNSPRGRGLILFGLENGVLRWEDPAVADVFYKCFTDGLPQEWCASHYDADELVIDARHRLVEKGLAPPEVAQAAERIRAAGSPYGGSALSLQEICRDSGVAPTEHADLLVFGGCAARSLYPASLRSFVKILKIKGIPFNILDPEPCCGMPLYQLGDFAQASLQAKAVAHRIADSGAGEVVLLDPDCYRMFMTRYARFDAPLPGGVNVFHVSDWLRTKSEKERWIWKKRKETYTYHDPSALARFMEVHESPRRVLEAIFDRQPSEMFGNRRKACSCGESGGMLLTNPEIAREAAARRYEQAVRTGAELLITSSPSCASLLSEVKGGSLPVLDLVELIAEGI